MDTDTRNDNETTSGKGVDSSDLLSSAMALVGKIKLIHASPEHRAVWEVAQAHRGAYAGLKYEEELDALEAAIVAEHEKIFNEDNASDDARR